MSEKMLQVISNTEVVPLRPEEVVDQVELIQQIMRSVMKEGEHYGRIPGTDKLTLLKSGAEKLSLAFRLRPKFDIQARDLPGGHREYVVTCDLYDSEGRHQGQGVGSCTSMESKYRWRQAERTCPECGQPAIIRGKKEYGGGWLCFGKKGGCGAKYPDGDQAIESQQLGRIEHPDIADTHNTVLKMAKKRAQVDATLTATAASDIFTQDVGDDEPPKTDDKPPKAAEQAPGKDGRLFFTTTGKPPDAARARLRKLDFKWRGDPDFYWFGPDTPEARQAVKELHAAGVVSKYWLAGEKPKDGGEQKAPEQRTADVRRQLQDDGLGPFAKTVEALAEKMFQAINKTEPDQQKAGAMAAERVNQIFAHHAHAPDGVADLAGVPADLREKVLEDLREEVALAEAGM